MQHYIALSFNLLTLRCICTCRDHCKWTYLWKINAFFLFILTLKKFNCRYIHIIISKYRRNLLNLASIFATLFGCFVQLKRYRNQLLLSKIKIKRFRTVDFYSDPDFMSINQLTTTIPYSYLITIIYLNQISL